MRDLVSVVVPTRNRSRLLRDCLESLTRQAFPEHCFEIIAVDDGSDDDTVPVVRSLAAKTVAPRVSVIRSPGTGLNAARNTGAAAASGDPVVLLDDDTEAPVNWLSAFVEATRKWPQAACFGGPVRLRLEGAPPRLCGREPLGESEFDLGDQECTTLYVLGGNMAVRRWAFTRAGWFDPELLGPGDCAEWQERLRARGGEVRYVPEAWIWHRRTADALRLGAMVRNRFRYGIGGATFERRVGRSTSPWREVPKIFRYLAHGVRWRCAWGLLAASTSAGRFWGGLRSS